MVRKVVQAVNIFDKRFFGATFIVDCRIFVITLILTNLSTLVSTGILLD